MQACLFCGGDSSEPDHAARCDGRQGKREADFDGETYEHPRDYDRLRAQLGRVRTVMLDHQWHTLADLAGSGDPQASVSARLRDLRKAKFGGFHIERRYVTAGLWEYRLLADEELRTA
jgi:hypothetical protein